MHSRMIVVVILVFLPRISWSLDETPRGYSFHISGSGSSCDAAKENALARAESSSEASSDPSFANNEVLNRSQALALCQVRGQVLGVEVVPVYPEFPSSWSPDLTGIGRTVEGESECSRETESGTYYVTNNANGLCVDAEP